MARSRLYAYTNGIYDFHIFRRGNRWTATVKVTGYPWQQCEFPMGSALSLGTRDAVIASLRDAHGRHIVAGKKPS